MSAIDTIRALISDKPLYAREVIALDGVQVDCQVSNFPMVVGTVIITPSLSPITSTPEEDTGVIVFSAAPAVGNITVSYRHVLISDEDIQAFIDLEASADSADLRLPAADALDAIANNQALIQKKIKLLDLETDGPALAKALRERAKSLRDQVFSDEMQVSDFDVAEQINIYDSPALKEKIVKDWMREGN